jgi:galactoside O-acetyltransferase
MAFYTEEELIGFNFKALGKNVKISKLSSIYNHSTISLGNNVRIDDFCILTGEITIGSYVHISAYATLYGRFGIHIGDFCSISGRCSLYSRSDDYNGEYLVNPTVPSEYTVFGGGPITLHRHALLGCHSVVMPGVTLFEGAACGTMSFIKSDIPAWTIAAGVPAKYLKDRSKNLLKLEKALHGQTN